MISRESSLKSGSFTRRETPPRHSVNVAHDGYINRGRDRKGGRREIPESCHPASVQSQSSSLAVSCGLPKCTSPGCPPGAGADSWSHEVTLVQRAGPCASVTLSVASADTTEMSSLCLCMHVCRVSLRLSCFLYFCVLYFSLFSRHQPKHMRC